MKKICVFCGSNYGAKVKYMEVAQNLGRFIAEKGFTLVYGGGNVGLMGERSDAFIALPGGGLELLKSFLKLLLGRN
jgi:predicted Rossmann-fold nucleotide-binding protein